MSIRQKVLDAFGAVLSNNPTTWKSTYQTRIIPNLQVWPFLMVYSTGDSVETDSVDSPIIYYRQIDIVVIGMLKVSDITTIEGEMETFSLEVEQKLTSANIRAQGVYVQKIEMVSTELSIVATEDEAIDHAEVTMNYRAYTVNSESDPSTLI